MKMKPEDLKNIALKSGIEKDIEDALEKFEKEAKERASKGEIKMVVPAPKIGNLFYNDDKRNYFAKELQSKGFTCRKVVEYIGGVRQDPLWFVFFTE